jgi:hypothetical protein
LANSLDIEDGVAAHPKTNPTRNRGLKRRNANGPRGSQASGQVLFGAKLRLEEDSINIVGEIEDYWKAWVLSGKFAEAVPLRKKIKARGGSKPWMIPAAVGVVAFLAARFYL